MQNAQIKMHKILGGGAELIRSLSNSYKNYTATHADNTQLASQASLSKSNSIDSRIIFNM